MTHIDVAMRPELAYTEDTVTIYHDHTAGRMLILSRTGLEYAAPHICISTTWDNVRSITRDYVDHHMRLVRDGTPIRDGSRFTPALQIDTMVHSVRAIGMRGFGYPQNTQLCANLIRVAPHLTPDVRLAERAAGQP